ncbi:MAG: membrane protein DedA with SNARE-associated domain [Candidatus Nitrosomirales archaeon]|jgi:membrane protein DedA with SNARE-associated domain
MVLLEIVSTLIDFITSTISGLGYGGIFLLMVAESALIPIPSEVIMPFSGYLVSTGEFNAVYVVLAGSVGNLAGSLIAYYAGSRLGREFILRYGKYVLLRKSHLELTETYFKKYGDRSIFIGRLLPAVRTYISLPAGLARMNMRKFIVYTLIGSIIWNSGLTYIGMKLGQNWETMLEYSDYIDIAVVIGVIVVIVLFVKSTRNKSTHKS